MLPPPRAQTFRFVVTDAEAARTLPVGKAVIPGVKITGSREIVAPANAKGAVAALLDGAGVPYEIITVGASARVPSLDECISPEVKSWVRDYLTEFQAEGVPFLVARSGGFAFWPCGSGKTLLAILWMLAVAGPAVFVARSASRGSAKPDPSKRTRRPWPVATIPKQIVQYTDLEPVVLEGEKPRALDPNVRIHVISWEILPAWVKELKRLSPVSVVFDESHQGKSNKRWEAIQKIDGGVKFNRLDNISSAANELSIAAQRRLATSATPVKDRVRDLWAQLDLIEPYQWGGFRDWTVRYCCPGETPIWMNDYTFKPIAQIQPGDVVIGWKARAKQALPKSKGKYTQRALHRTKVLEVFRHVAPVVRVTMESGRVIRCTADHRWLTASHNATNVWTAPQVGAVLMRVVDEVVDPVLSTEDARAAGWLAGMYDGEGCNRYITQSSKHNPKTWAELHAVLTKLEIPHTMLENTASSAGGATITGGRGGMMRFLQICRPVRFASTDKTMLCAKFRTEDRVVKIEEDRVESVYGLKTETGNYVAWGFASKNCDGKQGLYGWDAKGRSNEDELLGRLAGIVHNVPYSRTHGKLPPKRREVVYLDPKDQNKETPGFLKELKHAVKMGPNAVLEVKIALAASRKKTYVVNMVKEFLAEPKKIIVFTGRRKDVELLRDAFEKIPAPDGKTVPVFWGYGGMPLDHIAADYAAHPGPCVLVGTGDAFGESIDGLQDTDHLIQAQLPYTPGQITQREGRVARHGQKRDVTIHYIIAEGTVDEHVAGILISKLPVVEKVVGDEQVGGLGRELEGIEGHEAELVKSILDSFENDPEDE